MLVFDVVWLFGIKVTGSPFPEKVTPVVFWGIFQSIGVFIWV